jgi:hypothetical protein
MIMINTIGKTYCPFCLCPLQRNLRKMSSLTVPSPNGTISPSVSTIIHLFVTADTHFDAVDINAVHPVKTQ